MNETILFPAYPDEQRIGPRIFRYRKIYEYVWEHQSRLHRLRIPPGWTYDGASVPRLIRPLIDPDLMHKASGPHDYGYHHQGLFPMDVHQTLTRHGWVDALTLPSGIRIPWSRRDLDRLFVAMCREDSVDGPSPWQRRWAYRGIRVGGLRNWHQNDPPAETTP